MAKNLRAKIPAEDTLVIRDVNEQTMQRFAEEAHQDAKTRGAAEGTCEVELAGSSRDVAEKAVCIHREAAP